MANCENRPKQEWDDIRFTHCHPYVFLPLTNSRPHPIPTACQLSIHSSSTQFTKFHITVSITQQLHHMHKNNNLKSLFSHNCNGSIIKHQKSLAKTPKQCFSQTTNCIRARLVITPHSQTTTCNCLLLSHLFPHNYNVSNMH